MILKSDAHLKNIRKLTLPLTCLKGVGPKRAILLAQKGLHTILDLLFFTPIRYEDRTRISPINKAKAELHALVKGKVIFGKEERFYRSGKRLFKILIEDKESPLELLWFHYRKPHLTRFATPGTKLLAYGIIKMNKGRRQMVHPEITIMDDRLAESAGLGFYPVYSAVKGVSSNTVRSVIKRALEGYLPSVIDPIPREITGRLDLPDLVKAIKHVHLPSRESSIDRLNQFDTRFYKRLIFDRFFLVMLAIRFVKKSREKRAGPDFPIPSVPMEKLESCFPFRFTPHQIRSIEDIFKDFASGRPMNRLLHGDVGCGKTVVAAAAAYICALNSMQVAIMVPTQVLASQHLEYFSGLSDKMGFRPVLLTGRLKEAERQDIYDKIGNGQYNLVIGTQSLIQERLSFPKLGLVIIDEQHRFGVRERALMERKGENPHLLVMTATPIPRTLAITVYGDMDMSIIKGYPAGHKPVVTRLIPEREKRRVLEILKERMSAGHQAFVICPVIEGSEDADLKNAVEMAQKLRKILQPSFRIGLIHGRLSSDERGQTMNDFRKGLIDLLVGTTVIEVGVHVPRATTMIIEHPERFGLAQIHQLRGRVGRGSERGICLLMLSGNLPGGTLPRLKTLVESHDGFEIAQKDLELRGQGELTGIKQAGVGELEFTEMMREPELLLKAKREAENLIDSDPDLFHPENATLKAIIESVLAKPLKL